MITDDDDKKAAEAYADKMQDDASDFEQDFDRECCVEDFLAGVAHARLEAAIKEHGPDPKYWPVNTPLPAGWYGKPHVVADGDLPADNSFILVYIDWFRMLGPTCREGEQGFNIAEFREMLFWIEGEAYETDKIKYWWPLPEVE